MNQDFRTTFLVLEDDANDALLIRRAFTNAACRAFVCRNTSEARAYLLGAGMYGDRDRYPFPDIFVSDLNLGAGENGLNFLEWLRSRHELKEIPVIVLSGSINPKDTQRAKTLSVSRMIQKPSDPSALQLIVLKLSNEFCPPRHATRPTRDAHSQSA